MVECIQLRGKQPEVIADCLSAMRQGDRHLLLCCPTGFGKTILSIYMISRAASRGLRCGFFVHRIELLRQTLDTFGKFGICAGIIASGFPETPGEPIQIASIPTLWRRRYSVKPFDLIIVDEAAHVASETWRQTVETWPGAWRIGLTATPERLDGRGFGDLFDRLILGPTTGELIRDGWLAPYRAYAPKIADLSGLHTRMGDFIPEEIESLFGRSGVVGDAIEHYGKLAHRKRAIVFCATVKHSANVAEKFSAAGIKSVHVDGKTPDKEREAAINDFRAGRVTALCNCNLYGEGLDIPGVEALVALRPTQSLAMHLQQVGRVLRPASGKTAIIIDHAGNCHRHGLPDDEREWTLEGHRRKPKSGDAPDEPIKACPSCYAVYRPAPSCPYCGAAAPARERTQKEIKGELEEVQREEIAAKRTERRQARTYAELVAIGAARGYKNPQWWAKCVMNGRAKATA